MKLSLPENIRALRKQRKMTQEKLAEALGVTVGAVYKWEVGLSVPELDMIVEMADLFDTSVDALLGYRMKDNRLASVEDRICTLCRALDPAALQEAEKALAKYPHSFRIAYACAGTCLAFGTMTHDKAQLARSIELFERSLLLLPQNDDPRVSEAILYGNMSVALFLTGEREKSLELMKKNNAGGIFNSRIGTMLALWTDRPQEAAPYLSDALLDSLFTLLDTVTGFVFLFRSRGDWARAIAICELFIGLLTSLKKEEGAAILDKTHAELLALLACVQMKAGMREASLDSLESSLAIAKRFDREPDYSLKSLRFADSADKTAVFDVLGATAYGSVAELLELMNDPELSGMWKEAAYGE